MRRETPSPWPPSTEACENHKSIQYTWSDHHPPNGSMRQGALDWTRRHIYSERWWALRRAVAVPRQGHIWQRGKHKWRGHATPWLARVSSKGKCEEDIAVTDGGI